MKPDLYEHLHANLRYSTQALPVNVLLDTLLRPNLDSGSNDRTCIEWRYEPKRAVTHVVLGDANRAGGQWAEEPTSGDWDARALSYAEMLSLPEYTFEKHHQIRFGRTLPPFERPSRRLVADYYATYPKAVGIAGAIRNDAHVNNVTRTSGGFYIASHEIHCKSLILASGVFKNAVAPPPLLRPITGLNEDTLPLLVIGSGFSAADAIIAAPKARKIIHVFKWLPEDRPSPLRGCHKEAYPEYAGIYRQMRLATVRNNNKSARKPGQAKQANSNVAFHGRDWSATYEGLPNASITNVLPSTNSATVTFSLIDGTSTVRHVGGLAFLIGRAGSLDYLDPGLHTEVLAAADQTVSVPEGSSFGHVISGRTFRARTQENLQVAKGVFVAGSLTGDSLVRYAFGGCVQIAGILINNVCRHSNEVNESQDTHTTVSAASHNIDAAAIPRSRSVSSINSSSSTSTEDTQGTRTTQSTPNNETSNETSGDENGSVNGIELRRHDGGAKPTKRYGSKLDEAQIDHRYYAHPPDSTALCHMNDVNDGNNIDAGNP